MSAVDLASARAECQHWRNECEHLEEKILGYDRVFGFLCAHMDRRSLCQAISSIKETNDVPLPPAVREFMTRNLSRNPDGDAIRDTDGDLLAAMGDGNSAKDHPAIASAKSLTKWASRYLNKVSAGQVRVGSGIQALVESELGPSSRRSAGGGGGAAKGDGLILAETRFKMRDLEQQLRLSQTIRGDLLTKAIEAQQKLRALGPAVTAPTKLKLSRTDVSSPPQRPSSHSSSAGKQWKERCGALERQCEELRLSLSESNLALEKKVTESKMPDPRQHWYKAELRTAKKTISQLHALLQAKQEKIELMSKLREIPRRGRVAF